MADEKQQEKSIILGIVAFVAVVVIVGLIGFFTLGSHEEIIQGELEVSEFRVACKLPGRVMDIRVEEGDYVHVGDTLALLEIPEIEAQQKVAEASEGAANALSDLVSGGSRSEAIQVAKQMYEASKAACDITELTYKRVQNLFDEGVVSAQKRDEALAAYKAAQAQVEAAKSQYDMAQSGARSQEKVAAQKQVEAAKGTIDMVTALLSETVQIATVEGEVSEIYPKKGELVGLGSPIMSIAIANSMWATFNVREDQLNGLKQGDKLTAYMPAFQKDVELEVTHIKDEGSYATWKATKTNGQYDLKTFEVKAKPLSTIEGMKPGMSLIVKK